MMKKRTQNDNALVIGVSACLLGESVRYDGGHKTHDFVTEVVGRLCRVESICPEVEAGLGVPRPAVHLVAVDGGIHAIGRDDEALDITAVISAFNRAKVPALHHLSGYIFKSRSPSCGLNVTVLPDGRAPGLFAAAVRNSYPLLPCIEDDELGNPMVQSNFLERVVAYRRWQAFMASMPGFDDLVTFHGRNALLLMSHGRGGYNALSQRVGDVDDNADLAAILAEYGRGYMAHVARQSTRSMHVEVLHAALERLSKRVPRAKITEFKQLIVAFEQGRCGLWGPLGALRMLVEGEVGSDLTSQNYLYPSVLEVKFKVIF